MGCAPPPGSFAGGYPPARVAVVDRRLAHQDHPRTVPVARTGSPPTPTGPVLCPTREESSSTAVRGPVRAGGPRSARGYPAAVSSPVGADPAVVGPYLATALGERRWEQVTIELIAAGMSNLTY